MVETKEEKFKTMMEKLRKRVDEQKAKKAGEVIAAEVKKETPVAETPKPVVETPKTEAPKEEKKEVKLEEKKESIVEKKEIVEEKKEVKVEIPPTKLPTLLSVHAAKINYEPAKMLVKKTFTKSGEVVKEEGGDLETIETPNFVGPVANVSMDMGATINKGDYQSVKVSVFISVPCYLAEIDDAFNFVQKQVGKKLNAEIEAIRAIKL